jgi:hypothetical protein
MKSSSSFDRRRNVKLISGVLTVALIVSALVAFMLVFIDRWHAHS